MLDSMGAPVQSEQTAMRWMANGGDIILDPWGAGLSARLEQCLVRMNDFRATGAPEPSVHLFGISLMREVLDTKARQEQKRLASLLTHRQRVVLTLVQRGVPTRLIAEQLCITPSTVERHINDACKRLGVSGRNNAARLAQEMGLIPREE